MLDKTVIITGGNTGLGYECARSILASAQDWRIVIAGRDPQRISEAAKRLNDLTSNSQVEALTLDLASLQSVRHFAGEFAARGFPPLHAIVCNAGIQVVSSTTYTEDGFETTFGVNHLGHFLLVNLLIKPLVAPARVIVVSSDTHDPANKTGMPVPVYKNAVSLAFPDRNPPSDKKIEGPSSGRRRYTTSKLCNIFFAYELSRRLESRGLSTDQKPITSNACNPGFMPGTGLARDYSTLLRFVWNTILPVIRPIARFLIPMHTISESGQALARLVLDPALERVTGKYYSGLKEVPSSQESYDSQKAFELWESSASLVHLTREEALL